MSDFINETQPKKPTRSPGRTLAVLLATAIRHRSRHVGQVYILLGFNREMWLLALIDYKYSTYYK